MSKTLMSKLIIAVIAILVIVGGGVLGYTIVSRSSGSGDDKTSIISLPPKMADETNLGQEKVYEDSSGISFSYYDSVKVADVATTDPAYYTSLSLQGNNGSVLLLKILDTKYKSLTEWAAADPSYKGVTLLGATSLGGVSANEYQFGAKNVTVAIDQGILYIIESDATSQESYDLLVKTFAFGPPQPQAASGGGQATDITYEEEEVVE